MLSKQSTQFKHWLAILLDFTLNHRHYDGIDCIVLLKQSEIWSKIKEPCHLYNFEFLINRHLIAIINDDHSS